MLSDDLLEELIGSKADKVAHDTEAVANAAPMPVLADPPKVDFNVDSLDELLRKLSE